MLTEFLREVVTRLQAHPPTRILSGLHHKIDIHEPADSIAIANALECWLIVEQLRANEGASVTINSDNGDFAGAGAVVHVVDDWTGWDEKGFPGDTVLACLRDALAAKNKKDTR